MHQQITTSRPIERQRARRLPARHQSYSNVACASSVAGSPTAQCRERTLGTREHRPRLACSVLVAAPGCPGVASRTVAGGLGGTCHLPSALRGLSGAEMGSEVAEALSHVPRLAPHFKLTAHCKPMNARTRNKVLPVPTQTCIFTAPQCCFSARHGNICTPFMPCAAMARAHHAQVMYAAGLGCMCPPSGRGPRATLVGACLHASAACPRVRAHLACMAPASARRAHTPCISDAHNPR